MIKKKIDPLLINADKRLSRLMNGRISCKEEDIIMLLSDLKELTEAFNVLYRNLSINLSKFIDKN
jgi:hypothetical protein